MNNPARQLSQGHDVAAKFEVLRIAGQQEIIARYEPERAVQTLPVLLGRRKDRDRLLTLLERVLADRRVQRIQPSVEQTEMLARIGRVLAAAGRAAGRGRRAVVDQEGVTTAGA